MKKIISSFIIILLSALVLNAYAGEPTDLMRKIAGSMITQLKTNHLVLKKDPSKVYGMVRKTLLPNFDMNLVSRAVLGRHWQKASPKQRRTFISRFTHIVIGTYASALATYTNEKIIFTREVKQSSRMVRVDSRIVRLQGPPIPVSYRLIKRGERWKVYDLVVEGVSLVQSYRSQFRSILSQKGMSGLLKVMALHNAKVRS